MENTSIMGLSSGKFATYMMLGMPAITLNHGLFANLNSEYGFGYVMNDPTELPLALEHIQANYEQCSAGALRLYRERLCPTEGVKRLCDYLCEKG